MLHDTVHLSPPAVGGPDVSICFSNCSFFFFFASTDWMSKIPRDAASFCLRSAASASFALFSSGLGDGGADSAGHGKHSPMGTQAPWAGNPNPCWGLQQAPSSSKPRLHTTCCKAMSRAKTCPSVRPAPTEGQAPPYREHHKLRPTSSPTSVLPEADPALPDLATSPAHSGNLLLPTRWQSPFIRSNIKSRLLHKSHPIGLDSKPSQGFLSGALKPSYGSAPPICGKPRPFSSAPREPPM